MFCKQEEVQDFVATHSPSYVEQWIHNWQPYFCKGIDQATAQATMNTKLLMSNFQRKTSTAGALLPQGYHIIHDRRDNSHPVDSTQSTMHQWLKTWKSNSSK